MGRSVSSNWCIIPLVPEDAGKRFTVTLTPLITEIIPKEVEFLVGSNYNIFLGQLRTDAPQLIPAMMCIALGLIIFLIQFVSIHFQEKQAQKVYALTIAISAVGLFALVGQVFGHTDMGESRILSRIALCVGMVMVVIASFCGRKNNTDSPKQLTWKLLALLAVGIALDFFSYYTRRNSSHLIYSCLLFLIFLSVTFIAGFREISGMVYRDTRIGLFNKAGWNELMQAEAGEIQGSHSLKGYCIPPGCICAVTGYENIVRPFYHS